MTDDAVLDPIVAAIRRGDLPAAEQRCRLHLSVDEDPDVLLLFGICLSMQCRDEEAVDAYRRLTERDPGASLHWCNYAAALLRRGDAAAARTAVSRAIELAADDAGMLEQAGLLQLQLGMLAEARINLLRALAMTPASPGIRIHAARACIACRDHRADALLKPWREWLPLADELQSELADLLVQVSEPWDALELLEDLVRRVPADWRSQLLLAKICERINRPQQAEARLQWIAAAAPPGDAGIRREVQVQRAQLAMRRHEYAEARALLEQAGPAHAADDGHWFAVAKACDRLGDADAAMRALGAAHALQIGELRSSNPELLEPDAPLLPHVDDRVDADAWHAWPALRTPDAGQSPVFVVGFPRSGTTLLEQMLDAHPRLQSMDERPFLNTLAHQLGSVDVEIPGDLHRLDQRDCDELRKGYLVLACGKVPRRWDARLVDKNPLNMLWLPLLQRLYPHAQFILALRHPCDVIWSCYLQDFRAAPLVAACRSLEHLARAYVAAMENWLYHVAVFQPDVFVSRYEDLVADTSAQTRRIAAFLRLEDAGPMLHFDARAREKGFIRTPSYTQVVEPVTARSVGHWCQYRERFEPLLPILQPMLDRWGYHARPDSAAADA